MSATDFKYKIRARGQWDFRDFDTVRMEISVGQPYHEGAKMEAAMQWAFRNFDRVVLILGDSPQRYNIMFRNGYSEENAQILARGAGDAWLKRNADYIQGAEITRWDDWKRKPECLINRAMVSRLYMENPAFRATILKAMDEFAQRNRIGGGDLPRYMALTEQYLLEETAVFATAFNELGGISAYPGSFLETWESCINSTDPLIPAGLKKAHWTRITFDKALDFRALVPA